jgi:hypothetical protein
MVGSIALELFTVFHLAGYFLKKGVGGAFGLAKECICT